MLFLEEKYCHACDLTTHSLPIRHHAATCLYPLLAWVRLCNCSCRRETISEKMVGFRKKSAGVQTCRVPLLFRKNKINTSAGRIVNTARRRKNGRHDPVISVGLMLHSPLHYAASHLSSASLSFSLFLPCPHLPPNADGFDPGAAADAHRGQTEGVLGAPEGRGWTMATLGGLAFTAESFARLKLKGGRGDRGSILFHRTLKKRKKMRTEPQMYKSFPD